MIETHARALDIWTEAGPKPPNLRAGDMLRDLCLYVPVAPHPRGIDAYAASRTPPGGAEGMRMLRAMQEARFGLFRYEGPDPRGGARILEMGNPVPLWLMDETMPKVTPPGMPFFARIAAPDDFLVTLGWAIWADRPLLDRARAGQGGAIDTDDFAPRMFRALLDLGGRRPDPPAA